jgi:DnaJ-class molecular chaperone
MPRRDSGGSPFDSFLDVFTQTLGKTAKKIVPKCHICGLNAMPFQCQACARYACLEHAWINAKRAEAVCDECMGAVLDEEQEEEEEAEGYNPWVVLGISPEATVEDVKRAFRRKALKCHPDQGGAASTFQEVKKAYDAIMKLYAQESGEDKE